MGDNTGTIQVNGEIVSYTISTQSSFANSKQVVAECIYAGEPISGEPRMTQRAAETSLKQAITKKLDRDREIAEERQRLARWNAGEPKIFGGGGWTMRLNNWIRAMLPAMVV